MTPIRLTRTARIAGAAGGIAALTLGFAVPALACDHPTTPAPGTSAAQGWPQLSLAQQQQIAESVLAARSAGLDRVASKVANDPHLTDAQKTDFQNKIDQDKAAITTAENAVSAAQSPDDIKAAFVALWQSSATPSFPQDHHWWGRHKVIPSRHHDANAVTLADKSASHSVHWTASKSSDNHDNWGHDNWGGNDWNHHDWNHHSWSHYGWGDHQQGGVTPSVAYQHDGYTHDGYGHHEFGSYQHDSHGGWGH
ncbi:MAG TPA: hypothetical protein VHC18_23975 [Amycolatopsis sp.]|nr:hypothetical protein [Amycolatopsis sp.]